jgi:hypothetical protein
VAVPSGGRTGVALGPGQLRGAAVGKGAAVRGKPSRALCLVIRRRRAVEPAVLRRGVGGRGNKLQSPLQKTASPVQPVFLLPCSVEIRER